MTARLRISGPARTDLAMILATSLERWGEDGRGRYAALLSAAIKAVARDPAGPTTHDRSEIAPGIRSFHLKHARHGLKVDAPVHVVFYRLIGSVIEIIRVLHERMEPARHVPASRTKRRMRPRRRT